MMQKPTINEIRAATKHLPIVQKVLDAFERDESETCGCGSRLVHTPQGDVVCPDCGYGEI